MKKMVETTEITVTPLESTPSKNSLIVVANRLPFVLKVNKDGTYTRIAR